MQSLFDFEQAPPISVPYRFFLVGPLFIVAAGLLLAGQGADVFSSRWHPVLLAVLHLLTVGFLLQIMLGALLQILPVAVGANIRASRGLALVTQIGIVSAASELAYGFASGNSLMFRIALPSIGLPVAVYVLMCGAALLGSQARGATLLTLRMALLALVPAIVFGGVLAAIFGWGLALPVPELVAVHAAWAFVGWGLMLVMAVAYLVVPMFQLTPPYKPRYATAMPIIVVVGLLLWTLPHLSSFPFAGLVREVATLMLSFVVSAFALLTLHLQSQRRRKQRDVTLYFWRLGMVVLLAVVLVSLGNEWWDASVFQERLEILAGVLLVVGVFMSLINGMLYKIVPFLNWLHLQRQVSPVPNMKHMISDKAMLGQFRVHVATLLCLGLAVFFPVLVGVGGVLLMASGVWLAWNLWRAALFYRHLLQAS